jgi:hypothetical protein
MSSFIKNFSHPKTGKKQDCWCIDDFYGQHRYGYFFRKDGENVTWEDFDLLQRSGDNFDVFNEEDLRL